MRPILKPEDPNCSIKQEGEDRSMRKKVINGRTTVPVKRKKGNRKRKHRKIKDASAKPIKKDSDNHDYCAVCHQIGDVLMCDNCPRSYHAVCLDEEMEDFDDFPDEDWHCPQCTNNAIQTTGRKS